MRKSAIICLLFLSVALQVTAQKEVLFNMKYLPKHNYAATMKMDLNMEMTMTGDSTVMNQLKSSGQKFPMIMQMQSSTDMSVKTGAIAAIHFPIDMTVTPGSVKMKMNGVEQPAPPAATTQQNISGECTLDGKIDVSSVGGVKMDDAVKEQMLKVINTMQNSVKFPDKPMKVGDTFTQDVPMDMPLAGTTTKMAMKAVYKLIGIEKNNAYFDITFSMDMNLSGTMEMKGGGTGKLIYDITNNFSTRMQESMDINYTMVLPQMPPSMKMGGKMNMLIDQTTVITAN